jgi:hypothetical protein
MELTFTAPRALSGEMTREIALGKAAATGAARDAVEWLKISLRRDLAASGLKNAARVGNTIRSIVYPKAGSSFDAASVVFAKSPQIVRGLTSGLEIVPRRGRFLVIPNTDIIGRRGRKRWTLSEAQRGAFGALSFVPRPEGGWYVLADLNARARGWRKASRKAMREGRAERKLIFTLVPQVRLRRRADVPARVQEAGEKLKDYLAARYAIGDGGGGR